MPTTTISGLGILTQSQTRLRTTNEMACALRRHESVCTNPCDKERMQVLYRGPKEIGYYCGAKSDTGDICEHSFIITGNDQELPPRHSDYLTRTKELIEALFPNLQPTVYDLVTLELAARTMRNLYQNTTGSRLGYEIVDLIAMLTAPDLAKTLTEKDTNGLP